MEKMGGGARQVMPQRLDLYLIRWQFKACNDYRPCIILDSPVGSTANIMLVSSANSLRRPVIDFRIAADLPDFKASGLGRESYALGDEIHSVAITCLGKHLGRLEGELAREFEKWIG